MISIKYQLVTSINCVLGINFSTILTHNAVNFMTISSICWNKIMEKVKNIGILTINEQLLHFDYVGYLIDEKESVFRTSESIDNLLDISGFKLKGIFSTDYWCFAFLFLWLQNPTLWVPKRLPNAFLFSWFQASILLLQNPIFLPLLF